MARGSASKRLRRLANTTLTVLVAMGALLTAAYAATGSFPLQGELQHEPARAAATDLQGPLALTGASSVLFAAQRLQPGLIRVAQIRIQNSGATKGTFAFTPSALTDAPSGLPEPLSAVLGFVMEDVTNRFRPMTLYSGQLRGIAPVALGEFNPGESRIYRFTVSYPTGRTPAQDNPLQGASAAVRFDWDAVFEDPPAPPAPVQSSAMVTAPAATTPVQPRPAGTASGPKRLRAPATLRLAWRARRAGGGLSAVVVCRQACSGTLGGRVSSGAGSAVRLVGVKVLLRKGSRRIYRLRYGATDPAATAVLSGKGVVAQVTLSLRTATGTQRVRAQSVLRTRR